MSHEIREMINKIKLLNEQFEKYVTEENNDLSDVRKYLYDYFDLNGVIEPATVPVKSGYVRLYHQTDMGNFENIKKEGKIDIARSTGKSVGDPIAVWGKIVKDASSEGFYGPPKKRFTIEYQLPYEEAKANGGLAFRDITMDDIIAFHDPRLFNIKTLVDDDDYLKNIIADLEWALTFKYAEPDTSEHAYYLIAKALDEKQNDSNLTEVRYINRKDISYRKEKPLSDTETIRVYHGFNGFDDAVFKRIWIFSQTN